MVDRSLRISKEIRRGRGTRAAGSFRQRWKEFARVSGLGVVAASNRQPDRERRSQSNAWTGRVHRSQVQLHELTDDAETESQASVSALTPTLPMTGVSTRTRSP